MSKDEWQRIPDDVLLTEEEREGGLWIERTEVVGPDGTKREVRVRYWDLSKDLLDSPKRRFELERKEEAEKDRADQTNATRSRKADQRHRRIGDYAVDWALRTGPDHFAKRGRYTLLAKRLLRKWPKEDLGSPPKERWLREILSDQSVRDRIREHLEK